MAASLELHFFAADDLNGSPILTITDEDPFFKKVKLRPDLFGLGGMEITLARHTDLSLMDAGVLDPEVFVRVLLTAYSTTEYLPNVGCFLDKRSQVVVHRDENGAEEFILGGPGPKYYLDRFALGIVRYNGFGFDLDLEAGVWRWNEDATSGKMLSRIIAEDAAAPDPALPDLTTSFGHINDSDSVAWVDQLTGAGEYEIPIGTSLLEAMWDMEDLGDLYTSIYLGTVAAPVFRLDAVQSYGRDRTGTSFGTGVTLLREGANITNDALTLDAYAFKKATHVIIQGKDNVWADVVKAGFTGPYVKWAKIDFPRSAKLEALHRAGIRWLQRQDNGEKQITVELLPGNSVPDGLYFPDPAGGIWLGDQISVDTTIFAGGSPIDLNPSEAQLVTGFEMETLDVMDDFNQLTRMRSWSVKVLLNHERAGFSKSPSQTSSNGSCQCGKGCTPGTLENVLLSLSGGSLKASSEHGTRPAEKAVDGDDSTPEHWSAVITDGVEGQWIAADIGSSRRLTQYRVKQGFSQAGGVDEGATEMQLYGSSDSADWTDLVDGTVGSFDPANWTLIETFDGLQAGSDSGTAALGVPGEYRYVVLFASDGPVAGVGNGWNVQEWEMYAPTPGSGDPLCHGDLSASDGGPFHAAEDVTFTPAGTIAATNVQDAIEEVAAEASGGSGAPTTADYLVGTAQAGLSAEIVVGTSPGGELGGTWASPTVDATHSGSAHHAQDHASRHVSGGADSVKLDDLAAPDDNTDLNASTSAHGLLKKLDNSTVHFLRGDGSWETPVGSGGGGIIAWLQDISESGASFANFTVTNGTWASTGTIIQQTVNAAGARRCFQNSVILPAGFPIIIEAEVRLPSAGQAAGDIAAGIAIGSGQGAVLIRVARVSGVFSVQVENDSLTARRTFGSLGIALDVWYKLRLAVTMHATAYLDGTLLGTTVIPSGVANADRYGLTCVGGIADFRNLKAWSMRDGVPA